MRKLRPAKHKNASLSEGFSCTGPCRVVVLPGRWPWGCSGVVWWWLYPASSFLSVRGMKMAFWWLPGIGGGLSLSLPIYRSIYLSIDLSIYLLPIYLSIYLSTYPSSYQSTRFHPQPTVIRTGPSTPRSLPSLSSFPPYRQMTSPLPADGPTLANSPLLYRTRACPLHRYGPNPPRPMSNPHNVPAPDARSLQAGYPPWSVW